MLERPRTGSGHTVLAMDCALADVEVVARLAAQQDL
jgi:hypothetical protein